MNIHAFASTSQSYGATQSAGDIHERAADLCGALMGEMGDQPVEVHPLGDWSQYTPASLDAPRTGSGWTVALIVRASSVAVAVDRQRWGVWEYLPIRCEAGWRTFRGGAIVHVDYRAESFDGEFVVQLRTVARRALETLIAQTGERMGRAR